ncbi:MAG: PAS domain-containing protein [Cytophagaceae bacterium]
MKRSLVKLDNLQKYASYLYKNHLQELVKVDLQRNRDVDLPILKMFTHLSEEELLTMSVKSMEEYLTQLMEGRALDVIIKSMEDWKADKLPGISKTSINASDIALIYNVRKHSLIRFLPKYTQNVEEIIQLIREMEDFYTFQESLAIQTYSEIQKDELRKSETRLKNAQALANLGNWEYEPGSQNIIWSDQLYKIYGLPLGKVVTSEFIQKAVQAEDLDHLTQTVQQAIKDLSSFSIEYRIRRTDGAVRIILEQGSAMKDLDGKIILRGISQDITERKEAEIKLHETQHLIEKIATSTPQILYVRDLKTQQYLYINKKVEEYLGYTAEQILSGEIDSGISIIHPEDVRDNDEYVQHVINAGDGEIFTTESRVKHSNGTWKWMRTQEMVFKRDEKNVPTQIIGTSYDISDQKRAEEQLILLNQQLEERVRKRTAELQENIVKMQKINNDLDNFIYTASHDLKAPISNIEGLISALFSEIPVSESTHYIKELLETSIERFKTTIKDLTEITKVQKDLVEDVQEVKLAEVMEEIKSDLNEHIVKTGADIKTDFRVPDIRFSKKNLRSIIYNLLSNAIKYRSLDRPPLITITSEDSEDFVIFKVSDNGLGISAENKGKVFGMFKRFHDHVEGTGIGLYIVKRIIDNAGGKIEVESATGKGSTFKIYFRKF